MKSLIDSMNWRFAIDKFDTEKNIPQDKLNELLDVMRMTASSMGLQPFKAIVIKDREFRKKLIAPANGQQKVADSSHLIILCIYKNLSEDYIDSYFNLMANTRQQAIESLESFRKSIKSYIKTMSPEEIENWAAKQTYIALGTLLQTCAIMEIDSCPMEGFNPDKVDKVLNLSKNNLKAVLMAPIGYRAEDDKRSKLKKVRKSMDDFYEFL